MICNDLTWKKRPLVCVFPGFYFSTNSSSLASEWQPLYCRWDINTTARMSPASLNREHQGLPGQFWTSEENISKKNTEILNRVQTTIYVKKKWGWVSAIKLKQRVYDWLCTFYPLLVKSVGIHLRFFKLRKMKLKTAAAGSGFITSICKSWFSFLQWQQKMQCMFYS